MPKLNPCSLDSNSPICLNRLASVSQHSFRQLAIIAVVMSLFSGGILLSEEPYKEFLKKLRNERLFDLALVYLDDLEKESTVGEDFKSVLSLERGLLLENAASQLPAQNAQRSIKLDQAEAAIRAFLKSNQQHPRRGEAQLTLGNLLLTRAEEAKTLAKTDAKQDIPDAIKFFGEAHDLFQETVKEQAAILEQIKGARTDANDSKKKEYRDQVKWEIRAAQLYAAAAIEKRGRSRAESNPERKKDLEQALAMYGDLYMKEREFFVIRNRALFYRSGVQDSLGKVDDAIDGYQRVADQEGDDSIRMLQTQAVTELVKLFAAQGKFTLANERAEKWETQIRPDERQSPEVIALKIEHSKARIAWLTELEKKDKGDRVAGKLKDETRKQLSALLRITGGHQDEVRKLMGKLGAEPIAAKKTELPKVKNFTEALEAANERIQRNETSSIDIASLENEIADPNAPEDVKKTKQQQLDEAKATASDDLEKSIQLLQIGLAKFSKKDEREPLFDARQRLAYCFYKQKMWWEAIAVAEFLSYSTPGKEQGLRAGAIALASYGELFKTEDASIRSGLIDQLQPFAEYLVNTWPDSEESTLAASALVQLALINKAWGKAEKFLAVMPTASTAAAKVYREAGMQFYILYLEAKRNNAQSPDTNSARARAVQWLKKAVDAFAKDSFGTTEAEATNALARLLLADNQIEEAASLFRNADVSPIATLKSKPDSISIQVTMDTYRTALQVEVAQLAGGKGDATASMKKISEYIDLLEQAGKKEANGPQKLASIFVELARDLKEMLAESKEAGKRKKVAEALVKVASEAGKKAAAFNTKYWAADTLLSVADELQGEPAQAKSAFSEATNILDQILAKANAEASWMPDTFENQVKLFLAKSQRGNGKFEEAIETLASILEKNYKMLDAQMEAAKSYQAWGEVDPKYYKSAMEGGRPGKNGVNLIWGFKKIANQAGNNPKFVEQFYEACYQSALSRYKYALSTPNKKNELLGQAVKDIDLVARLYPTMGGPVMKGKFDSLLKTVQKSLSQ